MANSTGIRACRHEDDRFKEQIDMNKSNPGGIRGLTRVAVIGIALTVSSAQGVAADSLRPTVDTGGSGAGASAQEHREAAAAAESGTYYVIIDEEGNAIVPELVHLGLFAQAVASSPQLTCPPCATEA
jgi:hypothetical protein